MDKRAILKEIEKLSTTGVVEKKDNPRRLVDTLANSFISAKKTPFYMQDLYALLEKWMHKNLCVISPNELFSLGFTFKNNSLKEMKLQVSPNEVLIINFVTGDVNSWERSTGKYHYLLTPKSFNEFKYFVEKYIKAANN